MAKPRGRNHTTLTETAKMVVAIVATCPGVKMIAPGEIAASRANSQRITITHTTSGLLLTISGQGVQRVAVHTTSHDDTRQIVRRLKAAKSLRRFIIAERTMQPGI